MRLPLSGSCLLLANLVMVFCGCRSRGEFVFNEDKDRYQTFATQIEYPDADIGPRRDVMESPPPRSLWSKEPNERWLLTLEDAVRTALSNNRVMHDIGGRVVSDASSVMTVYEPALRETDPRFGPEAALSAFDAQFSTSIFWEKNRRMFNNLVAGEGIRSFRQDWADFQAEISKQAATGSVFALRNYTQYDKNNSPLNLFPSAYDTVFEAEVRHPLLQGSGIQFNRIAGPGAQPGVYDGVLIARVNTDISLADFEAAVRELLFSVQHTYWELYFAYRDLDAKVAARDAALETWRLVQRRLEAGEADREEEALAREQYFFLKAQVIDALSGTGVRTDSAGRLRPLSTPGGLCATERRLRFLLGLPANDGRMICPADQPSEAQVVIDWEESLQEALWRRVELRKQKWVIKRCEMEVLAARNFRRARLDAVGQYRWRGFGDDLVGDRGFSNDSAFGNLFDGDLQEWQLGLQMSTPIGNRVGHAAVRHAQWQLARERAIHRSQQLQIQHELSNAYASLERGYEATRTNFNRAVAAQQQLREVARKHAVGAIPLDFLLIAQRRTAEATSAYYRSLADYNEAIAALMYARGCLLEYYRVYLSEGPWSGVAHLSARKQARRFRPKLLDYCLTRPGPVSRGAYPQVIEHPANGPNLQPARPLPREPEPLADEPHEPDPSRIRQPK